MACGSCGKNKTVSAYVVTLPGQPQQTVGSLSAAQQLIRGVKGATYRPVR